MRYTQQIPLRGDLRITRFDAVTHQILYLWEKKNVITYGGTDALIKLLAPNNAFGANVQLENQIRSMRFGLNNTQPQRTDTGLLNEGIVSNEPVRVTLEDSQRVVGAAGTVEYVATLAAAMGNGLTYREAGLFTRGTEDSPITTTSSVMFSRQVFPDQPKSSSVELEFRWRLTIAV